MVGSSPRRKGPIVNRVYFVTRYAGGGFGVYDGTDQTVYTQDLGRFEDERYAQLFIRALEREDAETDLTESPARPGTEVSNT